MNGQRPNKYFLAVLIFSLSITLCAAQETKKKNSFWEHVQFGGGFGASFGSGYTDVMVAPGAIYNFNRYFAAGLGLQYSYVSVKEQYKSSLYGGSVVALFNPIDEIQISAELEQVRVNSKYDLVDGSTFDDNFWNTALFMGAGYRAGNVTIGVRFNVLHDNDKRVYSDAFMPFIRVYF